ncbi:MAG: 3-dehydroquinate synthase [Flavobacterium sp.]|nr:3-dehydroquinate synthase [Flavobacterium sp.]
MPPIQANGYQIHLGDLGYLALNQLLVNNGYTKIFILVDSNTNDNCAPRFLAELATETPIELIEIEPGEAQKTIATCLEIWQILTELGADKKSVLVGLGGGVISDLGGFVAATYKRGIDFIAVPTTLLAMVDAAIGGKNGVDLGYLKNQIGLIAIPKLVLVDVDFLGSLPQNEMRSGLAEMLKHGLIFDKTYWELFQDLSQLDSEYLEVLIVRSIEIKNNIVIQDPTEKGIRKALNFGHTLGHAIESYFLENPYKTSLLHGEAIAIGMQLEAHLSVQKGLLEHSHYLEIKNTLHALYPVVSFDENDIDEIEKLLIHDKKNEGGNVLFVLLTEIGKITFNQTVENDWIKLAFLDYQS